MAIRKNMASTCSQCGSIYTPGTRLCPGCRAVLPMDLAHEPLQDSEELHNQATVIEQPSEPRELPGRSARGRGGIAVSNPNPRGRAVGRARGNSQAEYDDAQKDRYAPRRLRSQDPLVQQEQAPPEISYDTNADTIVPMVQAAQNVAPAPAPAPAPARIIERAPVGAAKKTPAKRGTLAIVAAELEDAIDDAYRFWASLDLSDHISFLAVCCLLFSTLLPWSRSTMGLLSGGSLVWLFCVATVAIQIIRQRRRLQAAAERDVLDADTGPVDVGRLNLLQIVVGTGSVSYLTFLVLAYYLNNPEHLSIDYGWFVALASSMGLAYSGIARFVHDVPREP
jgi:hypothetical protein